MGLQHSNRFLNSLPSFELSVILSRSTHGRLPKGKLLFSQNQRPRYVYFVTAGAASVVHVMHSGASAQIDILGTDSLVGSLFLFGSAKPVANCTMLMDGSGYRVPLADMQQAIETSPAIARRFITFSQHKALVGYQHAICHLLHGRVSRLAKWLLLLSDAAQSRVLGITQQQMAGMLHASRPQVSMDADALRRLGAIDYSRGSISITNPEILRIQACECYSTLSGQAKKLDSAYQANMDA